MATSWAQSGRRPLHLVPHEAIAYGVSMLIEHAGRVPQVPPSAWVHSSAHVIGRVTLGEEASIWFNCVVRGDIHDIRIGARSNLQDLTMVHVTRDRFPTIIGDDVTIGHRVVVHGCTIGDRSLIGIGAIVLDGAEVEPEAMVGAGALVTPGMKVPSGTVVMGQPARVARALRPDELEHIRETATHYAAYARSYMQQGIT